MTLPVLNTLQPQEAQYDTIQVTIPNEAISKDVLRDLTFYNHFMKDGATLVKPNGKTEMTKYALKVNMRFGNEPFEFIMTPGREWANLHRIHQQRLTPLFLTLTMES